VRKRTRAVRVSTLRIGGNNPIVVQSMTKTKTRDVARTVQQMRRMERAGCELIRLAVVNKEDATALVQIKKRTRTPLIADIHFDYRLAMKALDAGVDKLRINPGNIGATWKVVEIIKKARDHKVPIRIGVNSGSLPKAILKKYGHPTAKAIVETVKSALKTFEKHAFQDIVISAKGADVLDTIHSYRALARTFMYPLHIGITEAGMPFRGSIKSAVGMGVLLNEGIGDTIRVSLTADPVMEVIAAYEILRSLGLREYGPLLISCPICGRCEVDLVKMVRQVKRRLKDYVQPIKVAVMGCVVNGPGEAREADFGIACGMHRGIVFAKGKEIKRVQESKLVDTLFEVIDESLDHK
jgi:(E)-4-hydroxy-3-methylbut-2-enyl-diphosphate synthase